MPVPLDESAIMEAGGDSDLFVKYTKPEKRKAVSVITGDQRVVSQTWLATGNGYFNTASKNPSVVVMVGEITIN